MRRRVAALALAAALALVPAVIDPPSGPPAAGAQETQEPQDPRGSQDPPEAPGVPAGPGLSALTAARRMALNLEAMDTTALVEATGADGDGIIIAVIDTGVDPSHPALAFTTRGRPKIVDWVDFSGAGTFEDRAAALGGTRPAEGDVPLTPVAVSDPESGEIEGPDGRIRLGPVRSASGVYAVGLLDEARLPQGAFGSGDANGDGSSRTRFAVVAVDTVEPGLYDTVIVDGDGDGDLSDEQPLRPFRLEPAVGFLRPPGDPAAARTAFVVTDLAPDGSLVNLGFDGSGHGTHVAGVAAGYDGEAFRGVAPGAQLMVLKALSSSGEGAWSQIAAAVDYASLRGADIITISIDALTEPPDAGGIEANFLTRAARDCRCLIIMAAGNDGPGIGSGSTPGSASSVFAVGAFYTPDMVEADFGYRPAAPGVWSFSGMGPRADGSLLPNVVAPGRAPGPVPVWASEGGYLVFEGTSVAAPHAAGAAALLLDAARRRGLQVDPVSVGRALERGARALSGYNLLEQGYGAISLAGAWEYLQRPAPAAPPPALPEVPADGGLRSGPGAVHHRGTAPGGITWRLGPGGSTGDWQVEPSASWLLPDRQRLRMAPGTTRRLEVSLASLDAPGLYAGWVRLRSGDAAVDLLHSFVVPETALLEGRTLDRAGVLVPGTWRRHFIAVPPGAVGLTAEISVEAAGAGGAAARLLVYRPDGTRWWTGSLLGTHRTAAGPSQVFEMPLPEPGIWELIVEAPFVRGGDLGPASYRLRVGGSGLTWSPERWWVSFGPGEAAASRSIQVRRLNYQGPVEAVALGPSTDAPEVVTIKERASVARPAYHELRVPEGTALLEVTASAAGGGNVDLFLYRRRASGAPERVGRGAGDRPGAEVVRIWFPQPGTYVVWCETDSRVGIPVQLNVRVLPTGTAAIRSQADAGEPGAATWTIHAGIPRPAGSGLHHAVLAVEDTAAGYLLGVVPIVIETGQPSVRVVVQAVPARPPGLAWTTLTVVDAVTFRPVAAHVWIDGRVYAAPQGRLILRQPASWAGAGARLQVLPAAHGRREFQSTPGAVQPPFGTGRAPSESPVLHRRLAELWGRR
nr:hypothetical protein [Bacillota bacterium]